MSWVFVSINFFFFTAKGQDCEHITTPSYKKEVSYMMIDSSILKGDNYTLIAEASNNGISIYKFSTIDSNNIVIEYFRDNSIMKRNVIFGKLSIFENIKNEELWIYSDNTTHHVFDMFIICQNGQILQVIPFMSTLENVLFCIKKYDFALFKLIEKTLTLKKKLKD